MFDWLRTKRDLAYGKMLMNKFKNKCDKNNVVSLFITVRKQKRIKLVYSKNARVLRTKGCCCFDIKILQ